MINKFGTCIWHPDHGIDLIYPDDIKNFPSLTTAVFHCTNADKDWLTVEYGTNIYRVSPKVFKVIPTPKFLLGQKVFVSAKNDVGEVTGLTWHIKDNHHIYLISFNGKKSSRRYSEDELCSVEQ